MGIEMGNNSTSSIKDNISEQENVTSQDVHANGVKEENQNILTSLAKDVMENSLKNFNDISQEDDDADDLKEEVQTITIAEAKDDAKEQATLFSSTNISSILENDSLEADTNPSDKHMENQMLPTAEAEDFQEKVPLLEESLVDAVKEGIQMIPTSEEKDTGVISNNTESMIEKDSLVGDSHESEMNMENQVHYSTDEAQDVGEKAKGIASEYTRSSPENGLLKGKDDEEIAEMLSYDDETSELEGEEMSGIRQSDVESLESENCESMSNSSMEGTEECRKQEDSCLSENLSLTDNHDLNDESSIKHDEEDTMVLTLNTVTKSIDFNVMEKSSNDFNLIKIQLGKDTSQEDEHADEVKGEIQTIPTVEAKDAKEKATLFASSNTTRSILENDSLEGDTHESEMKMEDQGHPISEAEDIEEKAKGMASDHIENELLKGKDNEEIAARLNYDAEASEPKSNPQEDKQDGDIRIPITKGRDAQGKTTFLASDDDPLNLIKSFGGEGKEITGVRESEKSLYAESFESENCESLSSSSLEGTKACRKHADEDETMVLRLNAVTKSNDSELQEPPSLHHDELVKSLSDMESQEKLLCANNSDERNGNELEKDLIDTSESETIGKNNNGNILTNVNYTNEDSLNPFPETSVVDSQLKSDQKEENCKVLDEENKLNSESKKENSKDYKPDQCMKELKEYNSGMVKTYDNGERNTVLDTNCVVPEAETVSLIADTNENPESSYAMVNAFEETDMSDQCNSFEETINHEEYFTLQNSTYLKQTNESKYFDLTVEKHDYSKLTVSSLDLVDEESIEKESEKHSQQAEATSAATILANSGYETRLSIESNSDNPIIPCQIQKSPSFNLDLQIEARKEESDQTPLLYQDKSTNESLLKQAGINISNSMPHSEYEMPVEEKIVTMERSYSEISKAPFTSMLKDEEEDHDLVIAQTQDNHGSTNKEVKERRKSRSYFFSSCICCATMTN